jgi:NAD(P)-dependent dehydrogenase (short-subunit alcohol dehydrogenase family)
VCCRKFVDDFHQLGLPGLHVLVNNAGVHLKVSERGEDAIRDC